MKRLNALSRNVRCGCLAVGLTIVAGGQSPYPGDSVSINDARPLEKAARVLQALYGVPISYEDPSAYAYDGDLADPFEFRAAHPNAQTLPPRSSSLKFVSERLAVTFDLMHAQAAPQADVAKLLQGVIDQHASNGNPGRFKILETPAGLVVVPTATRNYTGAFVPDRSLLDLRISFPEVETDSMAAVLALCEALGKASGSKIWPANDLLSITVRVGANNEVARDVLQRLINGMHETRGGIRKADGRLPVPKFAWTLTLQPGIYPPHGGTYLLELRPVGLERRDAKGFMKQRDWIYQ
jgi:hypothetical protein